MSVTCNVCYFRSVYCVCPCMFDTVGVCVCVYEDMGSSPSAGRECFQLFSLSALFLPHATRMTDGGSQAALNSPLPPAVLRLFRSKSKNLQYHRVIWKLVKPPVNPAFTSRKKKIIIILRGRSPKTPSEGVRDTFTFFKRDKSTLHILNNTIR